jgi:hypothetical protein
VLRICIPVHNEATTIGVLLWRLRSVFQGFSREYDVVVYDDASSDGTDEVLEPYRSVMPLTVLRGAAHRGYAASIDALVRHVAADDEYARRDAMVLLQGDFTESPEHLPELVKRFEGGADLVAVHRTTSDATPHDERRLRRWGRWAVSPFLRLPPVADPFTGFRLVRISVLRELLKALGNRPVCAGDGWAANIDFALNVTPFARRIENVEFAPRYDVRQRASRRRGWPDVVALFHWARSARRVTRPAPGGKAAPTDIPARTAMVESTVVSLPAERAQRAAANDRSERGERAERGDRGGRPERGPRSARDERPSPSPREERQPREARNAREERALRGEDRPPRPERPAREQRPARAERPTRDERIVPAALETFPAPEALVPDASTDIEAGVLDTEGMTSAPQLVTDGDAAAPEKRGRRRRRRSRKDRGTRTADSADAGVAPAGSPSAHASDSDETSGTSDDGEGEEESDDAAAGDSTSDGSQSATADGSATGDVVRRKRRSRRRRRGRRPGGPDAGGGTDAGGPDATGPDAAGPGSSPPSVEPPTA